MDSENKLYYKIVQLMEVFIGKYNYKQVILNEHINYKSSECWLTNMENPYYQVIRLTLSSSSSYLFEKERIDNYLSFFRKHSNSTELKFLDIHICQDSYEKDNEPYDFNNIDYKFSNGVDVKDIYPEIYDVIHNVDDGKVEVERLTTRIIKTFKQKKKNLPFHLRNRCFCTYIIIGLCIVNYLLSLFLKYKFGNTSSVFVILGADYKTFTFGLKQFYRLFTYAFVHNDIFHLFCNMISLYNIGTYVEYKFGHTKFLIILFFSILCGALTQEILIDNGLCLGMSAGIYGLLVVFVIDTIQSRILNLRSFVPIMIINIGLNFMSNVAWTSHLGGAIGGFVIFYYLQDYKNLYRLGLCILLLLCLIYKYATIDTIESIYAGTDFNVLEIYDALGLKNYANNLLYKLIDFYNKYGG